jgi:hypothetical protein
VSVSLPLAALSASVWPLPDRIELRSFSANRLKINVFSVIQLHSAPEKVSAEKLDFEGRKE